MNVPRSAIIAASCLVFTLQVHAADGPITSKSVRDRIAANPKGAEAKALAADIQKWVGRNPNAPKIEELDVTWVYPSQEDLKEPRIVSADKSFAIPLVRLADTDLYIASTTLPEGRGFPWHYEADGKPLTVTRSQTGRPSGPSSLEVYKTDPDSVANPKVPAGMVSPMPKWKSKIFAGTSRDWWVYVPAQYTPEKPACVMVFQDGAGYLPFVPTVFDNLIAKGEMPITVAIMIQPGNFDGGRSNRSFEYDTLSDQYARFLLEEILPEVEKTTKLRHDGDSRAIAGISSGGICAWTVAWERPSEFSKVLSWVGSFTNIASGKTVREGGHNYEALIRKTPAKPIRVLLQDGANDLDNANGNWPLANQTMAKSLAFSRYDYKFVFGEGFHSNKHGRAVFSDSLRWLWTGTK